MDGNTGQVAGSLAGLADSSAGDELNRLAARAYRPTHIEIDDALRHHWLVIRYQPKIDLQRKYLVGAEALARIRTRYPAAQ